ncbi:MAG TPA: hypothetical protein VJ773_07320, partial [Gemmatimonadales bacterium]|nr:hypothetical protein [Gemmatimonadales bacterium]
MSPNSYDLFDSPAGRFGLAWTPEGLSAVALPGAGARSAEATLGRLAPGGGPGSPPAWVRSVARRVAGHLAGQP